MNSIESLLESPYRKELISTKFYVSVYEFILFDHIRISVRLCNDNEQVIDTRLFILNGDDYSNWSNPPYSGSDDYIINWVKQRLKDESNNN